MAKHLVYPLLIPYKGMRARAFSLLFLSQDTKKRKNPLGGMFEVSGFKFQVERRENLLL